MLVQHRESPSRRAQAELIWIGLQQRLLSSIEAFARTLGVHERTRRKVLEEGAPPQRRLASIAKTLLAGVGRDDEAELEEAALETEEELAAEAATAVGASGAGDVWRAAIETELAKVAEMRAIADAHRGGPDGRVAELLDWIEAEMCPGLEHPMVRRLLDRFTNQGLVHHDLSRACLAVSPDAVPRVVLLGHLSLWGEGAAPLHKEIVRVAARWVEPEIRKAPLRAYAREAERQTMEALDRALD